jgi:hypothetical protein
MPIHSLTVDLLFHHGSTHDKSTVLVMLANIMAHGLPIHRSTFSAGGNTGPALPTNLLVMAGIRRGGDGILLLLVLLEALFGRQFSWWKVTFFLSSFLLVLVG